MTALAIASSYWGGGGFILVPYDNTTAVPSARFASIVRAYDPDHVVVLQVPVTTFEAWYPGSMRIAGVKDDAERMKLISNMHQETHDSAAEVARGVVASWCSPMRSILSREDSANRRETISQLKRADSNDRFYQGLAPTRFETSRARLAADESWRSDVGLLAALRVGVASSEPREREEPTVDALYWLVRPEGDAPTSLVWDSEEVPRLVSAGLNSWFADEQGLIQVSRGYVNDRGAVVVGDSGEDFALALAYDRIIGNGVWLTPELLDDPDTVKHYIEPAMWKRISELEQDASTLTVSSSTLKTKYLNEVATRIQPPEFHFTVGGVTETSARRETVEVRPPNVENGFQDLVVNEHVGVAISVPVTKHADGSMDALAGLETPIPTKLLYAENTGRVPYWYVDVTLTRDATPRARDLSGGSLTIEDGPFRETTLRASKDGFSLSPRSMGFVPAGALLSSRIGRPQFRALSMRAWVEGMAKAAGLGVRLSSAGRQSELVRSRLGSRQRLLDLMANGARPALRAFVRHDRTPKDRDPDVVVLGLDPYLSFKGIDDRLPGDEVETTKLIDELASARLLRRGLVLDCEECGRPSFVDADRLGQRFECPQCATMNALVSRRWKHGVEPGWFYDLHAVFRDLLAANGDVPLLAASRLQRASRAYTDAPELEFFELESGHPVAEVDVIASVDREVVLVEAKATDSFPSGKRVEQADKLLLAAKVLRADKLVLATTQPTWKPTDIDHVRRLAAKSEPFSMGFEVLTSLG